jgi:hypothetical protein
MLLTKTIASFPGKICWVQAVAGATIVMTKTKTLPFIASFPCSICQVQAVARATIVMFGHFNKITYAVVKRHF